MTTKKVCLILVGVGGILLFAAVSSEALRLHQVGDVSAFTRGTSGKIVEVKTTAEQKEAATKEQKDGVMQDVKIGMKMTASAFANTTKNIVYNSPLGILFTPKERRAGRMAQEMGDLDLQPQGYSTLESDLPNRDLR